MSGKYDGKLVNFEQDMFQILSCCVSVGFQWLTSLYNFLNPAFLCTRKYKPLGSVASKADSAILRIVIFQLAQEMKSDFNSKTLNRKMGFTSY